VLEYLLAAFKMAGHSAIDLARSGEQQERTTIAFLTLAWSFILLRIWTRTYVISNFGWDDSTMILAGVSPMFPEHVKSMNSDGLLDDFHCLLLVNTLY
jgi:hypothetical protein